MCVQLAGKRLLLVHEHATERQWLMSSAVSWGMRLHAVASAVEALAVLGQGEVFDAAIFSTGADTLILTSQIRQLRAGRGIPLIALASEDEDSGASSIAERDLAPPLVKSVKPSQLYETLKAMFEEAAASASVATDRPHTAHPMADQRSLQILVAEDSVVNQQLTLHLLAQLGYQGDLVGTGLEVIQALQGRHYDIVLMDVHMPEMNGCDATRRIRQQIPPEQRPRIIALTASENDDDRAQCLAAGMDDYIRKPVQEAEMQAVLQRWGHTTMAPLGQVDAATIPEEEFTSLTSLRTMQTEGILNAERDIVTELIDMFLEDTPPWLVALHEALLRSDARTFAQAAHSLKGSCGTIGAKHMATICAVLEERGRQGHLEALETWLDDLSTEFQRVRQVLEGMRQYP